MPMSSSLDSPIEQLLEIMRRLRDPEKGCPWDQEQTLQSLVSHTLEEAYEVAEAIENNDLAELADELGDLLFQVVFYSRIAEEADEFDFSAVCKNISEKLIRRHPHVFADDKVSSVAEQTEAWEKLKAAERAKKSVIEKTTGSEVSVLAGVSHALPALIRSIKLQKRAARIGFDWPDIQAVLPKVHEEIAEVEEEIQLGAEHDRMEHEIGDVLFAVTNLARHAHIDPEAALRRANRRFESRFAHVESVLEPKGGVAKASLNEMEMAWQDAKIEEQKN